MAVTPHGRYVWGGFYERGTLIWRSRGVTTDGAVECREALALPGNPHRAVLLRRVTALDAPARLRIRLAPTADFDRHRLRALRRDATGTWHGRLVNLQLRWTGAANATPVDSDHALELDLPLSQGQSGDLVLEISDTALSATVANPQTAWSATETAWRTQVPPLDNILAPRDAQHSYAVLRGLTGSAGGMVAAATTSLPECAAEGRNYDYRYVWIRDQCHAAHAATAVGDEHLGSETVRFITTRLLEHGPHLAPAYTADGQPIPRPDRIDLPVYPGGYDQIGNQVADQLQLDAFGEALLVLAAAARDCLHPTGRWQRSPEDPGLDGALLLPPLRGAIPPEDPRPVATLHAYLEELTEDHHAYRFRHDQRPSARQKAPSYCAGSSRPSPNTNRATTSKPPAGSNAPAPPTDRPASTPRNTTSPNDNYAVTSPKPSSTPSCSKPPPD